MGASTGFQDEIHLVFSPEEVRRASWDPSLRGCYATDLGLYRRAAGHFRRRERGSRQAIVIVCLEGSGTVCLGSPRQHRVRSGEFLLIPPGMAHEYAADPEDPWTIQWAHVVREPSLVLPVLPRPVEPALLSRVQDHFADVLALASQSGLSPVLADGLRWWLSLLLEAPPLAAVPGIVDADPVQTAVRIMTEHLAPPLGLSDLARSVGLSPSRFSAVFAARNGAAPMTFYQRLRLQKACVLLAQTALPVGAVARAVGYDDPLHFSRVFRQKFGLPPSQWRKAASG